MMILLQRRNNLLSLCTLLLIVVVVATTTTQGFVVPSSSIHVVTRWKHKVDTIDTFPCYDNIRYGGRRCQTPPPATVHGETTTTSTRTRPSSSSSTTTTELYMTTGMSPRITNPKNTLIPPPKKQYEDKSKQLHHNHGNNLIVAVGVFIWALMLSLLWKPLPINMEEEGGYLMYYHNQLPEVPNTEYVIASSSSNNLISKLQITPTPGIGFGGIGFGGGIGGPHGGFLPMPFGGFGMGFTVRNLPPPAPTQETTLTTTEGNIPFQNLDVQKQRLKQIQEYEKSLENQIKTMEQKQEQQRQ